MVFGCDYLKLTIDRLTLLLLTTTSLLLILMPDILVSMFLIELITSAFRNLIPLHHQIILFNLSLPLLCSSHSTVCLLRLIKLVICKFWQLMCLKLMSQLVVIIYIHIFLFL